MNKYIKPEFMLTSLQGTIPQGTNCSIQQKDKDILAGIIGSDDWSTAFGIGEDCENEISIYCKFSAADLGATQVLFS